MSQNTPDSQYSVETDAPAAGQKSTAAGVSFAPAAVQEAAVPAPMPTPQPALEAIEQEEVEAPIEDRRKEDRGGEGGVEKRKNVVDRRTGLDRRVLDIGSPTGLERRRGPGRRRSDDRRSAEEGEMTDEQFEFVMAIDTYKRLNKRPFPSWTEVLEVVKQLGYRKVAASSIRLPNTNGRATSGE
ncbi:MAG TPA: hypothetical protein VM008_19795 [Phycisphaerae bacterium]|nr:hypothetical protein [Phycisphaerae bacterium]